MYTCINPGAVGITLDWEACLPLAQEAGFEGIDVPVDPAVPAAKYREALEQHGLLPGGMGLPFHLGDSEAKIEAGLAVLPAISQRALEIGQTRFYTWIRSFSDQLTWQENWQFHVTWLGKTARILAENGCRLGLEFLGPQTLREGRRYEFVHTMDGMLELGAAAGPNVGLLLDAYHWYTARGSIEDLYGLNNEQVVYVHINDAPAGVPVEQQQDLVRALPGATGVIDLAGFLDALRRIGYDGPVVPEPFEKSLAEMPPAAAARQVGQSMRSVWTAVI